MSVNDPGTHIRRAEDEARDHEQAVDNLLHESWKQWPNEAGVRPPSGPYTNAYI